jgi:hypothetical protein
MRKILGIAGLALGLLLPATAVWGETINVPDDYLTIQEAVDAAYWGDEILIAPGDSFAEPIHEAGAGDTTLCCVIMKSGITLRGSGIGQTIIDADSSGRVIYLYQCEEVEIRDLTVTRGFAEFYGSGIYNSSPSIRFCRMDGNHAKSGGGLDVELHCEPYLYDCQIINNRAPFAGGVRLRGSATLDHCIINGNATTGAVNVLGGGILVVDVATPTISYCEITNNECFGDGGGIAFIGEGTGGLLEGCLIAGNISTGQEGHGGGISVGSGAGPTIQRCIVSDNHTVGAWSNGGGMYVQYSSLEMSNCTFHANWTEGDGAEAGNVGIETSLFIPLTVNITHSMMVDSPDGRGIYFTWVSADSEFVDISCCDVHGNAGGDGIYFLTGENGNFSLDPLLCDPGNGNFHVEDASPCAPGNHPEGSGACDGLLIGAMRAGCSSDVDEPISGGIARLLGNRPNPFGGSTVISFMLPQEERVRLEVVDVSGRRVAMLHDGLLPAGLQQITWNGATRHGGRAESGVYFYRLRCAGVTEGRPMLHLR